MKTKACVALVGVAGGLFAGLAFGQDTTMSYSIKWDKPTIENGQTNTGAVWAEITPGIGSSVKWTTPPGKGQQGTIWYFANTIFDTLNLLNGSNGTLAWTVPEVLNGAGLPGTANGGGILDTWAGQPGAPLNPNAITDNPIKVLDLEWTDVTGGSYEVDYAISPKKGKMFLYIGIPNAVGHDATFLVGMAGGFSVVPAPAVWCFVGLGTLAACRRRR